jgi:hypothetical protein
LNRLTSLRLRGNSVGKGISEALRKRWPDRVLL